MLALDHLAVEIHPLTEGKYGEAYNYCAQSR